VTSESPQSFSRASAVLIVRTGGGGELTLD